LYLTNVFHTPAGFNNDIFAVIAKSIAMRKSRRIVRVEHIKRVEEVRNVYRIVGIIEDGWYMRRLKENTKALTDRV
jgi:hypothetical protein